MSFTKHNCIDKDHLFILYDHNFLYDQLFLKVISENYNLKNKYLVKSSNFYEDEEFLYHTKIDYDVINIIVSNHFYTLLPDSYIYNLKSINDFDSLVNVLFCKKNKNTPLDIKYNKKVFDEKNISSLFLIEKNIEKNINDYFFPNIVNIQHLDDLVLKFTYKLYKTKFFTKKYLAFLMIFDNYFIIVIYKNFELIFFNNFDILEQEDIIYYTQVVIDTLKIPKFTALEIVTLREDSKNLLLEFKNQHSIFNFE